MLNTNQKKFAALTIGALSVCLIGGGIATAQTKQLKSPSASSAVVVSDDAQATIQSQGTVNAPNGSSSSYSVVIENKTTPDGKVVQSRKVWQNGQLVEEEEKTLDADDAQNGLSATIQLPNGQVAPGGVFSSEDEDDVFGSMPSSPFEAIRQMEEQMRAQQEQMRAHFEALRQQLGNQSQFQGAPQQLNMPNMPSVTPQAPSKFWIGATIETVPEFLLAQLPIEEEQGVWVQYVAPDSPAAKVGLKRYDVIYKIGDKIVSNPKEVSEIVEQLGAQKVAIEYYRKGKLEKGELTVEERPARAQNGFIFGAPQQNKSFRVVRPGLIVPSTEAEANAEAQATTEQAAENAEAAPAAEQTQPTESKTDAE